MKSYTDLEQSKVLAEILPLKSADMYYPNRIDIKYQGALPIEFKRGNPLLSQEIAAWSLTTLLGVLEIIVDRKEGKTYLLNIEKGCTIEKDITWWHVWYEEKYDGNSPIQTVTLEELVDACYEIIIRLHELNLL